MKVFRGQNQSSQSIGSSLGKTATPINLNYYCGPMCESMRFRLERSKVRVGSIASSLTSLRHGRSGSNPGNGGRLVWAPAQARLCASSSAVAAAKWHDGQNSASHVGQISATSSPRPFPARGAYRDRHERGRGCGGRGSVGAQVVRRAVFRERATSRKTTAPKPGQAFLAKTGGCVRQNRVVLAPVAGVKSVEILRARPGLAKSLIRRRR
jgi:hypothetical protein